MQAVMNMQAKTYAPANRVAQGAALAYIDRANRWSAAYATACSDLSAFLRQNVKAKALGFVARDALNMFAFGVVFEQAPGAGFIAVPAAVADRVREQGLRGEAYFPDMSHPLGKQAAGFLQAISRTAEQRPLLTGVPGVRSVALQEGKVVISRAAQTSQGVAVYAAASAVAPAAEVVPFEAPKKAEESLAEDTRTTPRRRNVI